MKFISIATLAAVAFTAVSADCGSFVDACTASCKSSFGGSPQKNSCNGVIASCECRYSNSTVNDSAFCTAMRQPCASLSANNETFSCANGFAFCQVESGIVALPQLANPECVKFIDNCTTKQCRNSTGNVVATCIDPKTAICECDAKGPVSNSTNNGTSSNPASKSDASRLGVVATLIGTMALVACSLMI